MSCDLPRVERVGSIRTPEGHWGYVEAPTVLDLGGRIAFIGSPGFAIDEGGEAFLARVGEIRTAFLAGFITTGSDAAEAVPAPIANQRLHAPRAIQGRDGSIDILWLPTDTSGQPGRGASVLWSRWNGTEWTTPMPVKSGPDEGSWNEIRASNVDPGDPSPWLIAAPGVRMPGRGKIVRLVGGQWTAEFTGYEPDSPYQMYPSIGSASNGSRVMAYVGHRSPDRHVAFIRRSTDGVTWHPSVALSEPGSPEAHDTRLVRLGPNRLGVVWAEGQPFGFVDVVLALSPDGGASWARAAPLTLHHRASTLQAVGDAYGGVHVVSSVERVGEVGANVLYASWREGEWTTRLLLPDSIISFGTPTIGAIGSDHVVVTWPEHRGNDLRRPPVTKFAVLATTCREREPRESSAGARVGP